VEEILVILHSVSFMKDTNLIAPLALIFSKNLVISMNLLFLIY